MVFLYARLHGMLKPNMAIPQVLTVSVLAMLHVYFSCGSFGLHESVVRAVLYYSSCGVVYFSSILMRPRPMDSTAWAICTPFLMVDFYVVACLLVLFAGMHATAIRRPFHSHDDNKTTGHLQNENLAMRVDESTLAQLRAAKAAASGV